MWSPSSLATIAQRREGGARVLTNVFVRDMDLAVHDALDSRRLEMVADGCPSSCTATRVFALSLLDRRPVSGSDTVVPSVSKVMRESRFC